MGIFSSKALIAKLRAMYGKRLTRNDFSEMMRKSTVSEIAGFLKYHIRYKEVLGSIQESFVHRGQLENLLRKSLFNPYINLVRYTDKTNHFYDYIKIEIEIEQLLDCMRHLCTGQIEKLIVSVPGFFIPYASFNLLQLANITDFGGLLKVVQNTPYYPLLLQYKATFGAMEFTSIETTLKTYYYSRIKEDIEKYSSSGERLILIKLADTEVELYNLTIIYRLKMFYNASAETVRKHIIYTGKHKQIKKFEHLIQINDKVSFIRELNTLEGYKHLADLEDIYIENDVKSIINKQARTGLRFSTDEKLSFMCYMILSKIELYNIINIVEGVRYKVKPEQMEKFLVD